jgi:D-alanine-D-alanine ligase
MHIAFTYNIQLANTEEEAEFDRPETVEMIARGLRQAGHRVDLVEVSGPTSALVARLESLRPDLIFNTAEGSRGRFREGFYPALFEQLGIPYTGSDAYVCTTTLDKRTTKMLLNAYGVPTPRWRFVDSMQRLNGHSLRFPLIVKPNFEGSSKGITGDSVVENSEALNNRVASLLVDYPAGVLVEEYIVGRDLVVPYLEGVSPNTGGVLEPAVYDYQAAHLDKKYPIYDFAMKSQGFDSVRVKVPANITERTRATAITTAARVFSILGVRDVGRVDFRITEGGAIYFLEVNALPSFEQGASIYLAAALVGLGTNGEVLGAIVRSAMARQGGAAQAFRPDAQLSHLPP